MDKRTKADIAYRKALGLPLDGPLPSSLGQAGRGGKGKTRLKSRSVRRFG